MKVTQNCWRSFASGRISRANKPFARFVGHADRARDNQSGRSRSAILSVSRAARRENANIRFIFSVLLRTFFAISGPFFFWKRVRTNPFEPNGEHLERKRDHDHFRYFVGQG
jgi:hypothetical protein